MIRFLQDHLGFTRNEINVIVILSVALLLGTGLRLYRDARANANGTVAEEGNAFAVDSTFMARSRVMMRDTLPIDHRPPQRDTKQAMPLGLHGIDLNTASQTELMRLPGIGEQYAGRIVRYRTEVGLFDSVGELLHVRGIGPKIMERIRPFVRVDTAHVLPGKVP